MPFDDPFVPLLDELLFTVFFVWPFIECWLLFFVVDLPFVVDLELVPDLTLFSTSFEENSNESRLLLFSDDVGCAFFV